MVDVNLGVYDAINRTNAYAANRMLFGWLCDDAQRVKLYECLRRERPILQFQSRAKLDAAPPQPPKFQQEVFLLTSRELVEKALTNSKQFSNAPYSEL